MFFRGESFLSSDEELNLRADRHATGTVVPAFKIKIHSRMTKWQLSDTSPVHN